MGVSTAGVASGPLLFFVPGWKIEGRGRNHRHFKVVRASLMWLGFGSSYRYASTACDFHPGCRLWIGLEAEVTDQNGFAVLANGIDFIVCEWTI